MTKDFKTQTTSESAFGQYGLVWMLGGVAIGLLVGLAMYALANKGDTPAAAVTPTTLTAQVTNSTAMTAMGTNANLAQRDIPAVTGMSPEHPNFSYHAVLPQLEVDIPLAVQAEQAANTKAVAEKKDPVKATKQDEAKPATAKAETKPPTNKTLTGMNGFQIGSYKTEAQAVAMHDRLKKNGLNARVEKADVNGVAWFRVRLGPASSPDMFGKWQQTLSGMGISPLAVRM